MKQYLITEEELSICLRLSAVKKHETNLTFKEIATDFLKSKQSVEIIASGKVLPSAYGMLIGDKTMQEVSNKIAMYWNKNIEIAIKVRQHPKSN